MDHPEYAGKSIARLQDFEQKLDSDSESSDCLSDFPSQILRQPPRTTPGRRTLERIILGELTPYYDSGSYSDIPEESPTPQHTASSQTQTVEDLLALRSKESSAQPDLSDQMTTLKKAEQKALAEKRIKAAKQAAQVFPYDPFVFLPAKYRTQVDFTQLKEAPPAVPKFPNIDADELMLIAGIILKHPHNYSETQDVFYRVAYTPAYLKYKTVSPFFEVCDATGKTMSATDVQLLPLYTDLGKLRMAKKAFEDQLERITNAHSEYKLAMMEFRVQQRSWEISLLSNKKVISEAKKWADQQNRLEDDAVFDTFFFGNLEIPMADKNRAVLPTQWNKPRSPPLPTWIPQRLSELRTAIEKVDKAIQELVNPKRETRATTAAHGTKRFFFEVSEDEDDDDIEDIDIPGNLARYRDWVADRHAAWDAAGFPLKEEDVLAKYHLPDEVPNDKKAWPASLKKLGITALRIDEDTTAYPWGKPALAVQRTLKKTKDYNKDAMFTDMARKALRWVEDVYFGFSEAKRAALSSKGVDDWKLSGKARRYMSQLLEDLNASKESHPTFFT
ncbi:hypothetical protein CFD26_106317 [Aspergillus turcosus]|uniref:Uncharacterized protein n=1 Tax=Aspergillus turcosus TaxID=1245748 RepID=A0A3R7JEP1_9EURO|nr:hypothetical protein CFD26_106317 [Aspergillus turcosus]